jgi:hypothetical protein
MDLISQVIEIALIKLSGQSDNKSSGIQLNKRNQVMLTSTLADIAIIDHFCDSEKKGSLKWILKKYSIDFNELSYKCLLEILGCQLFFVDLLSSTKCDRDSRYALFYALCDEIQAGLHFKRMFNDKKISKDLEMLGMNVFASFGGSRFDGYTRCIESKDSFYLPVVKKLKTVLAKEKFIHKIPDVELAQFFEKTFTEAGFLIKVWVKE